MKEQYRKLLQTQGFCSQDIDNIPGFSKLARWTPLTCATFGATGVTIGIIPLTALICPCTLTLIAGFWLKSGWFFIILGLLTLTGGFTSRSIYDRLYNLVVRHIFRSASIPKHGAPRKFGCTFGGVMYILSGIGFLLHRPWVAFSPAIFMIVFASIAGITQWGFASSLYELLFKNKTTVQDKQYV